MAWLPTAFLLKRTRLRIALFVGAALVAIVPAQAGQTASSAPPVQNDIELVSVIGNDADTATLISAILSEVGRSDNPVFVLGRQIRVAWLPQLAGVTFVRLSDAEAAARTSACGDYWIVAVQKNLANGNLTVSRRPKCRASVYSNVFALREGEWRLTASGVGSGWVGSPPAECLPCLRLREAYPTPNPGPP
jgi:hypothetical protein